MSSAPAAKTPVYKHLMRSVGVTLATLLIFPRVFQENDDLGFIYLLGHGFYAPWISKPFCWVLLQLYALFPGVGWYGVLHYLILALDLGLLFKLVDDWAAENALSAKVRRWLLIAAILLFYPFILRITFTSSSILSGGLGILALLACFRQRQPGAGVSWWSILGFGAVFSLAYMVRPEGLGAMIFLLPALLYVGYSARKTVFSSQGLAAGLTFLLPLALCVTLDKAVLRYPTPQVPYLNFVVASNDVFGFGYTEPIKNHPEWLAPVGWSRNDYGMLERFLYWDETVFSQAKINQLSAKAPEALLARVLDVMNPGVLLSRIYKTFAKTWLSNFPFTLYCVGLFVLFSMMGTTRLSRAVPGAMLGLVFMGSVLMQAVLRFPYRVACPVIIVSALSLLALPGFDVVRLRKYSDTKSSGLQKSAKVVLVLSALFLLVFNGPVRWVKTWTQPLGKTRAKLAALNQIQAQHYILREAGVIQISAFDPLDPTPLKYPDIGPGWLIQSPPYYQRLRDFGIPSGSALIPTSFNNPRILYFFKDKNLPVLQTYLSQHYQRQGQFVPVEGLLQASFFKNSHLYQLNIP